MKINIPQISICILCVFFIGCNQNRKKHFYALSNYDKNTLLDSLNIELAATLFNLPKENSFDPIDIEIIEIKKSIAHRFGSKETKSTYDKVKSQFNNNSFQNIEAFLAYGHQFEATLDQSDNILQDINNFKNSLAFEEYVNHYYMIRLLILEGNILHYQGFPLQSLSTYHYALYLIENSALPMERLKDKALEEIIYVYIQDLSTYQNIDNLKSNYYNHLSATFKNSIDGQILYYCSLEGSTPADKRLSMFLQLSKKELTLKQKHTINLNLSYLYTKVDNEPEAEKCLRTNIQIQHEEFCNIKKAYNLIISRKYLNPEEIEREEKQLRCSDNIWDSYRFINGHYTEYDLDRTDKKSQIDDLISHRALADKLFQGKSRMHLQDYYLRNSLNIFSLMANSSVSTGALDTLLILLDDTKEKERTRRTITLETNKSEYVTNNVHSNLSHLLRELSDFKNLNNFNNEIYQETYHAFQEVANVASLQKNTNTKPIINEPLKEVNFKKSSLLYITTMNDDYYFCFKSLNDISFSTINKLKLDSLAVKYLNNTVSKTNNTEITNELEKYISTLTNQNNANPVSIIYDGTLSQLPWQELLPNKNNYIFDSYNSWLTQRVDTINPIKSSLFSYSDKSTLSNKKPIELPELPFGSLEIDSLRIILNSPRILSGNNFTKENIIKNMNVDVMHISSHASYRESRLDNYFIIRDDEGNGTPMYSYEIYSLPHHPKVAFLSMCDSGNGHFTEGSGTYSLSKAFLDNGTQTVVKTIWPVNEKATYHLVTKTYQYWDDKTSLYDALDLAKKDVRSIPEYSHPYYWAGFVLEGNPNIYLSKE